jgi:hypothetical protein
MINIIIGISLVYLGGIILSINPILGFLIGMGGTLLITSKHE